MSAEAWISIGTVLAALVCGLSAGYELGYRRGHFRGRLKGHADAIRIMRETATYRDDDQAGSEPTE